MLSLGGMPSIKNKRRMRRFCFDKFVDDSKYDMLIKTVVSLIDGVLIWSWLTILGVEFPALWGLLTFLLHYVPNI
jgi:AI-2 transport protein TqsA